MAMFNSNVDYTKFIQMTPDGGYRIATFPEIRDSLINEYKRIYGNDIDTSSSSADGQFVNEVALIISNICETFKYSFKQMNPETATGRYLDVLCSYNNIERISATNSTAEIYIYNAGQQDILKFDQNLLFMDKSGNIWEWIAPIDSDGGTTDFPAGEARVITGVRCLTHGPIQALGSQFYDSQGNRTSNVDDADWNRECDASIYQFVGNENNLRMWQLSDAEVGREAETDEELRSRRHQMTGVSSLSILDGLKAALLNTTGVKDVFIYNNFEDSPKTLNEPADDGTHVDAHSIYPVIRYDNLNSSVIGQIIYNKLTPGVATTDITGTSGAESYVYNLTQSINYTIQWKKAQAIKPKIEITFKTNSNYDFPSTLSSHTATTAVEKNIVNNLQTYFDHVSIDEYLQLNNVLNIIQQSDIQKNGQPTLWSMDIRVQLDEESYVYGIYPMNLNYLKYDISDYKFTYITINNECQLVISTL